MVPGTSSFSFKQLLSLKSTRLPRKYIQVSINGRIVWFESLQEQQIRLSSLHVMFHEYQPDVSIYDWLMNIFNDSNTTRKYLMLKYPQNYHISYKRSIVRSFFKTPTKSEFSKGFLIISNAPISNRAFSNSRDSKLDSISTGK